MSPLKLHQFRSMLDCAIDDSIGLGVKIFRKELGEKSGRDWSKFRRLSSVRVHEYREGQMSGNVP
jgi:hypothetical protein